MEDEQTREWVRTDWDIVIVPQPDGTVNSRHIGLTLEGAIAVLKAVLADYEAESPEPTS